MKMFKDGKKRFYSCRDGAKAIVHDPKNRNSENFEFA
jgi:hypothetical protein